MVLQIEEASADAMKPLWFRKHSAEGYTVISHPEYGDIPAWNEEIAMALVGLINYGPSTRPEVVVNALSTLNVKENI